MLQLAAAKVIAATAAGCLVGRRGASEQELAKSPKTDIVEEKMSHSECMSAVDTTWLRMDRPTNPMTIVGVWMVRFVLDRTNIIPRAALSQARRESLAQLDAGPAGAGLEGGAC